jgi:uncharacterized repeat protein (TIGR01451 family)
MKRQMEVVGLVVALTIAAVTTAMATGTPAGTGITNQATVTYQDATATPYTSLSNIVTTIVSQVASIQIAPDNAANAAPSDTLYYAHTVTNFGNNNDVFDVTASSSQGWTTSLYRDVNNNGTFESATDILLIDTNTNTTVDTDSIAADDSLAILVCVFVPNSAVDATVDVTTVTATSAFDGGQTDNAIDTTTVQAPTLTVTKSVLPAGPQPPGTVLTYTVVVSNSGTGTASSVVLTDPIPATTTYIGSSIEQDTNTRTDNGGDDNADFNITNAGQVTVSIGSLASSGSTTIEFRVTIN